MQNEKKAYQAPQLIIHGNVAELTQANDPNADFLDADFPAGTPKSQLTFGTLDS